MIPTANGQLVPGFWNTSGGPGDAAILLHELGHALDLLQGQVNDIQSNDGLAHMDRQQHNSEIIARDCLSHF